MVMVKPKVCPAMTVLGTPLTDVDVGDFCICWTSEPATGVLKFGSLSVAVTV